MLNTCKCLNVSVDFKKTKLERIPLTSLKLSTIHESHPFFAQGLFEVNENVLIAKEVAALTVAEQVGDWIVETCVNCALPYLARGQDARLPNLISANLISDQNAILSLRKHENYSPAFRIVINPDIEWPTIKLAKQSVQDCLSGLQHHMGHVVKKQAEKTDENIRIYTDQQYELLTEFQDRALHDHEVLVRLLHNAEAKEHRVIDAAVTPTTPTKTTRLVDKFDDLEFNKPKNRNHATSAAIGISPRRPVTRSQSLFDSYEAPVSFDAEGIFNLEEMEDSPNEQAASEGESDTDHDDSGSHDEGIDVHRKSQPMHMARSLPVNVPAFSFGHLELQTVEFDSDALDQELTPKDIAASIKALAQSQHGESVFGDLPRPRFSTRL